MKTNEEKLYERAMRYLGTRYNSPNTISPAARRIVQAGQLGPDAEGWGAVFRALLGFETETGVPANHSQAASWAGFGYAVSPNAIRQGDTLVTKDGRVGLVDAKKGDKLFVIGLTPRFIRLEAYVLQDGDVVRSITPAGETVMAIDPSFGPSETKAVIRVTKPREGASLSPKFLDELANILKPEAIVKESLTVDTTPAPTPEPEPEPEPPKPARKKPGRKPKNPQPDAE